MTEDLVWGDPPPVRRLTAPVKKWTPILEQLRSRPGQNARLALTDTHAAAHALAQTIRSVADGMDGEFVIVARSLSDGKGGVWGRAEDTSESETAAILADPEAMAAIAEAEGGLGSLDDDPPIVDGGYISPWEESFGGSTTRTSDGTMVEM